MIRVPLNLVFKGERNYLQGPDLLAGLLAALASHTEATVGEVDSAFYQKTGRQPDIGILEPDEIAEKPPDAIGQWSADSGSRRWRGWYLASARPVETRTSYDEDSVVRHCDVGAKNVAFHGSTPLTPLELCVAMAKAMHIAAFPLPESRHWVVCRFMLPRPLKDDDKDEMKLTLVSNLGGRLTKSTVTGGGAPLGHVFFSPAER